MDAHINHRSSPVAIGEQQPKMETPELDLVNQIQELAREIESMDDEVSSAASDSQRTSPGGKNTVLWAKKRFPRQGIRSTRKLGPQRKFGFGATARVEIDQHSMMKQANLSGDFDQTWEWTHGTSDRDEHQSLPSPPSPDRRAAVATAPSGASSSSQQQQQQPEVRWPPPSATSVSGASDCSIGSIPAPFEQESISDVDDTETTAMTVATGQTDGSVPAARGRERPLFCAVDEETPKIEKATSSTAVLASADPADGGNVADRNRQDNGITAHAENDERRGEQRPIQNASKASSVTSSDSERMAATTARRTERRPMFKRARRTNWCNARGRYRLPQPLATSAPLDIASGSALPDNVHPKWHCSSVERQTKEDELAAAAVAPTAAAAIPCGKAQSATDSGAYMTSRDNHSALAGTSLTDSVPLPHGTKSQRRDGNDPNKQRAFIGPAGASKLRRARRPPPKATLCQNCNGLSNDRSKILTNWKVKDWDLFWTKVSCAASDIHTLREHGLEDSEACIEFLCSFRKLLNIPFR